MISEHERIVFTADLSDAGVAAGDVGTVVLVHGEGAGYEVEVVALDGQTLAVVSVRADQVRPVRAGEVAHARPLAA
jgi:hypothetical protein